MHVVLIGATGKSGSRLLQELVSRGHQVTAAVRPGSTAALPGARAVRSVDLMQAEQITQLITGADAVLHAYAPPADDTDQLIGVTGNLVAAVRLAGVPRLLMVGGAGGLEVAPGVSLIDSGHLPAPWLPIATSHLKALGVLQQSDIDWTYLAPAAYFEPGVRTGQFRLGTNELVTDATGKSWISMEDFAIALVDELEQGRHRKQRFSVGY